jgi:hypothetical protein
VFVSVESAQYQRNKAKDHEIGASIWALVGELVANWEDVEDVTLDRLACGLHSRDNFK